MYKRQVLVAVTAPALAEVLADGDTVAEVASVLRAMAVFLLSLIHISEPTRPY